ncbi:dTDP-glucose 4,6-dehydratase [Capsulimonas corticalis]|uniref:dTDP-glucose 4,6-dehydratase n=1 Tax=Capsulimonas corticalis TaxID=2219043 RepID=A0A402CXX4_9BACT|nr:dTDP-glucose 4,6-dehydratase [Capsulimonas corticalis]BDI32152.1 dTDP-glucose 4,6-dehydratase [Capsulimonas corticalis]
MQTLIITGAAGFIGSNFVRYMLVRYPAYRLIALDSLTYAGNLANLADVWKNPNFTFIKGDICDESIVNNLAQNADAIVNFAAETHVDRSIATPGQFIQTDVNGTYVLLEAARKHELERILHVSTDEVYGTIDEGSFKEGDALEPNSPYSASKASAEMMVRAYHQTYGLPTIVTRGSNTFGPNQYPEKMLPLFITNLIDDIPVPVYGDGHQMRDWMYVTDHCQGIDLALHHGVPGEAYNVGGDNDRKNIDVVHLLLEYLNKPETLIHHVKDRPGHDRRYSLDVTKSRKIGYTPDTDFESRLRDTVQWYVGHQEWWRTIKEKDQEYQSFMKKWYADRQ